jgi:hypothetical protein
LLNGDLVQLAKAFVLLESFVDEDGIEVFHVREGHINSLMVA